MILDDSLDDRKEVILDNKKEIGDYSNNRMMIKHQSVVLSLMITWESIRAMMCCQKCHIFHDFNPRHDVLDDMIFACKLFKLFSLKYLSV